MMGGQEKKEAPVKSLNHTYWIESCLCHTRLNLLFRFPSFLYYLKSKMLSSPCARQPLKKFPIQILFFQSQKMSSDDSVNRVKTSFFLDISSPLHLVFYQTLVVVEGV